MQDFTETEAEAFSALGQELKRLHYDAPDKAERQKIWRSIADDARAALASLGG